MPSLPTRLQQPSPVNPQVPIPGEFPAIPKEIVDRFPQSAADWQTRLNEFWGRTSQAIQEAQKQTAAQVNSQVIFTVDRFLIYANGVPTPMFALDATGVRLGNVLVVNTPGRKIYIGAGTYANANTPFYVDTLGNFSLGDSFVWDAETDTLTITGIINATSGTIGGFEIGADYIRDTANTFGIASTVTGGDDVRFWAGATFANRATAPFRVLESGGAEIGGFTIAGDTLDSGTLTISTGGVPSVQLTGASTTANLLTNGILITNSFGSNAAQLSGSGTNGSLNLVGNSSSITIADTVLRRIAANTLSTDDNFQAVLGIDATNIGATMPGTGAFTTLSASGVITSTLATGTAPFTVASTTVVSNLNVSSLLGATWSAPGAIGSGTPSTGAFTTLSATGAITGQSIVQLTLSGSTSVSAFIALKASLSNGNDIGMLVGSAASSNNSGVFGFVQDATTSYIDLHVFGDAVGSGIRVNKGGTIRMPNLAGAGTRNVVVDASGNLSAP